MQSALPSLTGQGAEHSNTFNVMSTIATKVGSNAQLLKIAFIVFAVTLLVLNAGLTAQFGWVYGGGIFTAIFLVLNFDVAGLAWYTARLQSGLSATQRAIAKIMSVVTILSSVLVSVIAVLLSFELVDLSAYYATVGTAGTWLVVVVCGVNTIALFTYQFSSPAERNIELEEELSAQTKDQVTNMKREAHAKAMDRANRVLMGKTDDLGDRIAHDVEREFLREMGALDMLSEAPTLSPAPPPVSPDPGAAAGAEVEDKEAVADPEPSEPTTTNITAAQLTDAANNYLIDNDGNLSGFEAHFHATHPIGLGNGLTYDEITASINEMTANAHKPPMDLRA